MQPANEAVEAKQKMYPAPARSSPNEFHMAADGKTLEPGLKETQFRVLPSAEQTREKLEELDKKTAEVQAAEAAIGVKVAAAKAELEKEEARLRKEREDFEEERAAFRAQASKRGK